MTALLQTGLTWLLQSTGLLGLGLLALWMVRRRGPAVQTLIGRATLVGVALALLLAGPLAGRVRPLWRVTLLAASPSAPASEDHPPAPNSGGVGDVPAPAAPSTDAVTPAPPTENTPALAPGAPLPTQTVLPPAPPAPTSQLPRLYAALVAVWCTGTAFLLLWLGVCQGHLTRLGRTARPLTSSPAADALAALTTRPPRLLAHPSVRSPFLAGVLRPAIFLPDGAEDDFPPDALRAILAHELAHLARRDCAWTLFCRVLCAVLWPQPLLWLLCRRLEAIGEEACDLSVLAQDCPPRAYADCLVSLAERHPLPRRERALGAGVAPFRSSLGRRVQRILAKGTHAMSAVSARLRFTVVALAVAAAIGGASLVSSAPAQPEKPSDVAAKQPSLVKPVSETVSSTKSAGDRALDRNVRRLNLAKARVTVREQELANALLRAARSKQQLERVEQTQTGNYSFHQIAALQRTYNDAENKVRAAQQSLAAEVTFVSDFQEKMDFVRAELQRAHAAQVGQRKYVSQLYVGNTPVGPARAFSPTSWEIGRYLAAGHPDPELNQARFLAGLTPVQGPGVIVTLNDSKKPFPANLPPGMTPPSLIHDTDINQVVNELKAAGAEAISVNDQRLVTTSAIRNAGPTILINNIPQTPPYVIKAIGNPKTLMAVLNLRGGIGTQIKSFDPAMFSAHAAEMMKLPAYDGGSEPKYARPSVGALPATSPASIAQTPPLRQFMLCFRVPRRGTHRFQVYVIDNAGQRLAFDRVFKTGEPVNLPVTAQGEDVSFRVYDNGKLTKQFGDGSQPPIRGSQPPSLKQITFIFPKLLKAGSETDAGTQTVPSPATTPKTRQVIGYGLQFSSFAKKRVCSAIKGSMAAKVGIPVDTFSVVVSINGRPASVSDAEFQSLIHSAPPLHLTLASNGKRIGSFVLPEKGPITILTEAGRAEGMAKELQARQAELVTAKQAMADTEQQLTDQIREALPQANPQTLATAFNVERRVGWQMHRLEYFQDYRALCRKKGNVVSYADAAQWESKAQMWVRQALLEEAKVFPRTSQTQEHLPQIHLLTKQLSDRQMKEITDKIILSAFTSVAREKDRPKPAGPF